MDNLNDVARQRENLLQQLHELNIKAALLKLEARSLVSVDKQVYVIKDSHLYELQLRQKHMNEDVNFFNQCFPCIYSNSKKELENEMLCLIQRLIDATIQLRQIKD